MQLYNLNFQFVIERDEPWLGDQSVCVARGWLGAGLLPAAGHLPALRPQPPPAPGPRDPGARHWGRGPAGPGQDAAPQERGARHQGARQELREERTQCRGRGAVGQCDQQQDADNK